MYDQCTLKIYNYVFEYPTCYIHYFLHLRIVPIKSDFFPNPSIDGSFVIEDTSCTENSQFFFECANLDFTNSRCLAIPNMPVYAAVLCSGTVTEVESALMY